MKHNKLRWADDSLEVLGPTRADTTCEAVTSIVCIANVASSNGSSNDSNSKTCVHYRVNKATLCFLPIFYLAFANISVIAFQTFSLKSVQSINNNEFHLVVTVETSDRPSVAVHSLPELE